MKLPYTIASAILLVALLAACTSIYEVGADRSKEYNLESVTTANSTADDVAPVSMPSGLYLTSNLEVDDDQIDRLYVLQNGESGAPGRIPVIIDGQTEKSGSFALLSNGRTLVFGQCYREGAIGDCDLLTGTLGSDGRSIQNVRVLPEPLNDMEWDQHPAISDNGLMMVFASERFGGKGGSDLWWSTWKNDTWDTPRNIGSVINTSGNELSPYLSPDGTTLYFASDTHPGMGGFDLYIAHRGPQGWSTPEPLGKPFNSFEDDIFFHGTLESDSCYFASNRDGGKGGFDIYRAVRKQVPIPPPVVKEKRIVLRITTKNAFTLESIPAEISVTFDGEALVVGEGRGQVEVPLQINRIYNVTASHSGYESADENVRTGGRDNIKRLARDEGDKMVLMHEIHLVPIEEEQRKIYAFTVEFDFNLFNIRPEEERKLDSAAVLLAKFPHSTVIVSGHTDSVGTNTYNIKLGYNRAKEVSDYVSTWLRRKKVRLLNDIEIRTYGEVEPVVPNSTDEGRQRNRRVEIAIVRNK